MVSYSSAKAEALGVPVPPGVMRRAERAVCLCLATGMTALWAPFVAGKGLPVGTEALPLLVAVSLIAAVANISAVRRLHLLARGATSPAAEAHAPARSESTPSDVPHELARPRESSA
jgi:hypothetical protein